jgi:phosphatidylserine synthase
MEIDFETAKKKALKIEDALIEVLLVDTPSLYVAYFLAKHKPIHPVIISVMAFAMRIISAALFFSGHLFYGGIFSFCGLFLDCLDGKVARITQKDIVLQGTVDFLLDQIAFMGMAFGLSLYSIKT